MKLTIDQIPCDLDPSQRIALDYDAQDLADVRSGNKGHALRLRLPATRTNDRIFGFAAEPYTGQRFNAAQHTAVLSDGEAKLLQGSVRLLSAAYDSDPEGYLIEIRAAPPNGPGKPLRRCSTPSASPSRDGSRPR